MLKNPVSTNPLVLDPAINWELLYHLIIKHRVWHQVYYVFQSYNLQCPITPALAKLCEKSKRRILTTAGETVHIARSFTTQTIEHCFIKGTLLNMHIYGDLITRPCSDIDIWINTKNYSEAVATLVSLGYRKKLPAYDLTGFKERWYMRHKHDMAFYHPQKGMLVELHFRLDYLWVNFFQLSSIRLMPIKLLNVPILVPEDDYHVLYLMIHGATHGWIRLRWLQDIALFIKNNQCDLMHVYYLAKQLHCSDIVEQALILVSKLFEPNNPTLTQLIQKPTHRATQLAAIAQEFIISDYELVDGLRNIKLFFKYRYYLAKLAAPGQKQRVILNDLFKIDELFVYVTFPDKLAFLYYAIYPLWVIKYSLKFMMPKRQKK